MDRTILVVEDDKSLASYLEELLLEHNYLVRTVGDGMAALKLVEQIEPDLVLLDLELPVLKGDSVCVELKRNYPQIPVIILTARDQTAQIVQGLNLGADDYMTKPFEADELVARINTRLRQTGLDNKQLVVGDLVIDVQKIEVRRGNQNIVLTPQEFKLLEYLVANKGRVLTRDMILSRIWGANTDVETRVVDVYMGYLRKKIDGNANKKLLHSVRGFGYKIDDQD